MMGWKVYGLFPQRSKYIVTVAPHTSNWDFVVGIAISLVAGLKIRFLIKHSLFIWPLSVILKSIGGVPVNRKVAHGVVGSMINLFNTQQKMVLAITPEGTRSRVSRWKVGFIHIGYGANVPIVPLSFNYRNKCATIGEPIMMTGDIETDLNTVKAFYLGVHGKNVELERINT